MRTFTTPSLTSLAVYSFYMQFGQILSILYALVLLWFFFGDFEIPKRIRYFWNKSIQSVQTTLIAESEQLFIMSNITNDMNVLHKWCT